MASRCILKKRRGWGDIVSVVRFFKGDRRSLTLVKKNLDLGFVSERV